MRSPFRVLAALAPVAGVLSGCAMGPQGPTSALPVSTAKTISGTAHGGQQPVAFSNIYVYTYGTTGYGTAGTLVASTTTDASGNFNVDFTCVDPTAAVYVLSQGGSPAPSLTNDAIMLGAAVGSCGAAQTGFVDINEISTAVLAFSMSHLFSPNSPDGNVNDHFGGPASVQDAIANNNNTLIPTILNVANGTPNPSTATFTNEGAKITSIANILGSCVNSAAGDSPACSNLFRFTTDPFTGFVPTNTLEAAVEMGLYPTQNVISLYSLQPPSGSSAFAGGLSAAPHDWSLAVSYTAPTLGLGVNTRTVSTIDIDGLGRVWFPTNRTGAVGVAFFDPATATFSPALSAPGLVRPEQVAIDLDGYVWVTDVGSDVVAGYPYTNPFATKTFALPGTTSTSLTVINNNDLRVGTLSTSTNQPAFAALASKSSYTAIPNTTPAGSNGYIGASLAGDYNGGVGVAGTYLPGPTTYDSYFAPDNSSTPVLYQSFEDAGQIVFTGADFIGTRAGYNAPDDGLCIFSQQNCFAMSDQATYRHPTGLAVDGDNSLWMADNFTGDVQLVLASNGSYVNGSNQVRNMVLEHDANNGATMTNPTGIAVDRTGNVWVSNYSCLGNGCAPGSFVLSEVIGGAAPTINPVAAQIVVTNLVGVRPSVAAPSTTKTNSARFIARASRR